MPILGKNTELHIRAYEYQCENPDCPVTTLAESFNGFLNFYNRMTERLADFICILTLESSCEGCARVCQAMGIRISGDSVIRLLLKRYAAQPEAVCGSVVGIDDFAFKKRDTYGTIVVDAATHKPVAILEGRDSNTLKEWLKQNQHIKTITRDRAGAYACAINEILPSAMQIADRFHLHQNFLEIVRSVLQGIVPANMRLNEATKKVENGIEETLSYMEFPSQHWLKIRTNNVIERMNREIRRRTRVVGTFPDGKSALMLVCARLRYVSGKEWGSKRYLSMKYLTEAAIEVA